VIVAEVADLSEDARAEFVGYIQRTSTAGGKRTADRGDLGSASRRYFRSP